MKIARNYSLKDNNTFLLDIYSKYFTSPKSPEELTQILESGILQENSVLIIGEGSNLLFTSNYDGLIIKPKMLGIEIIEENIENVRVKVGAGEIWDNFVTWSVDRGFWGIENLSLIPGTVGSAPIQNIGAYGVEVKDTILKVEGIDTFNKVPKELTNEDCEFGYRTSIFKTDLKNQFIVSSVSFNLSKKENPLLEYRPLKETFKQFKKPNLKKIRDAVISIRRKKLPEINEIGSAGSFFKNPVIPVEKYKDIKSKNDDIPAYPFTHGEVKVPAAWLIEQCGWKGKSEGDVGVYPKHALVIVNYGNASGKEIFDFSERIKLSVGEKYGINLEREVTVI